MKGPKNNFLKVREGPLGALGLLNTPHTSALPNLRPTPLPGAKFSFKIKNNRRRAIC